MSKGGGVKRKIDISKFQPGEYSLVGKAPNGGEIRAKGNIFHIKKFVNSIDNQILKASEKERNKVSKYFMTLKQKIFK